LWFFHTADGQPMYQWVYQTFFGFIGGPVGSLLFALAVMMVCWLTGYVMDKRKWYVRV